MIYKQYVHTSFHLRCFIIVFLKPWRVIIEIEMFCFFTRPGTRICNCAHVGHGCSSVSLSHASCPEYCQIRLTKFLTRWARSLLQTPLHLFSIDTNLIQHCSRFWVELSEMGPLRTTHNHRMKVRTFSHLWNDLPVNSFSTSTRVPLYSWISVYYSRNFFYYYHWTVTWKTLPSPRLASPQALAPCLS